MNLETALEIEPLSFQEIDEWAIPLFLDGERHLKSLAPAAELLCGKIGEVVEVCNWLWAHSTPGDILDDALQRNAVFAVARQQDSIDLAVRSLTTPQTAVLRWILMHPGVSPFSREALATTQLNAGTVNSAAKALMESELIEQFGKNRYIATTPLRLLATLSPQAWGV